MKSNAFISPRTTISAYVKDKTPNKEDTETKITRKRSRNQLNTNDRKECVMSQPLQRTMDMSLMRKLNTMSNMKQNTI